MPSRARSLTPLDAAAPTLTSPLLGVAGDATSAPAASTRGSGRSVPGRAPSWYEWLRGSDAPPSTPTRLVRSLPSATAAVAASEGREGHPNLNPHSRSPLSAFPPNVVKTSRYTVLNFVPLFLLEAFSRLANAYFLLICVIQCIPAVSITAGVPTSFVPLAFVLLFDGIATAREDLNRHADDAIANSRMTRALRGGAFVPVPWKHVVVGDVLRVSRGESLPADCVLLLARGDDGAQGECYLMTASLDGETSLKLRSTPSAPALARVSEEGDIACLSIGIQCEASTETFSTFSGELVAPLPDSAPFPTSGGTPLTAENLLLRGCVLRGVDCVYCMVVYTGQETKVFLRQSQKRRTKVASVERKINRYIIGLVGTLALLCLAGATGFVVWGGAHASGAWYLDYASPPTLGDGLTLALTYALLLTNVVPVSLYVSMKLVRSFQAVIMNADEECCYVNEEEVEAAQVPPPIAALGPGSAPPCSCCRRHPRAVARAGYYPLRVRSLDLNDELGQVTHLFADKTGTLTQNYMEFCKLTVNGVAYGVGATQIEAARLAREGRPGPLSPVRPGSGAGPGAGVHLPGSGSPHAHVLSPHVNYRDGVAGAPRRSLLGPGGDLYGMGASTQPDHAAALRAMIFNMAVNHSVMIERDGGGGGGGAPPPQLRSPLGRAGLSGEAAESGVSASAGEASAALCPPRLSSSSPDEEAFVRAAAAFGYAFCDRRADVVSIADRAGRRTQLRVVAMLPYSQVRKCMSVVVEEVAAGEGDPPEPNGRGTGAPPPQAVHYSLFCKGADTKLIPKLAPAPANSRAALDSTMLQTSAWAVDGLRTLLFAQRPVPPAEMAAWLERYSLLLGDAEEQRLRAAQQPNRIDAHCDSLEQGLLLQGATAVEDKLQEGVPVTLSLLREAGIQLFMLTGDKTETAVNVAFAARLLSPGMRQVLLTSEGLLDAGDRSPSVGGELAPRVRGAIRALLAEAPSPSDSGSPRALIVDEEVMDELLDGPAELRADFLRLLAASRSVIASRCRPDQKQRLVELVRHDSRDGVITLAVGDGANDVGMLLSAHIGVGIAGHEGNQAVNASDYSIGQFRFLQRLLLVHGRFNTNRMSLLIVYSMWKNLNYSLVAWGYSCVAAWSGQKFYIEYATQLYNLFFTGLPILIVAVVDEDVWPQHALLFPHLYAVTSRLDRGLLIAWLLDSAWSALAVFGLVVLAASSASSAGSAPFVFELGTWCYTAFVVLANARLAAVTHSHSRLFQGSLLLSVLLWVVFAYFFDAVDADGVSGVFTALFGGAFLWLYVGLVCAAGLLPAVVASLARKSWAPTYADLVRELQLLCDAPLHGSAVVHEEEAPSPPPRKAVSVRGGDAGAWQAGEGALDDAYAAMEGGAEGEGVEEGGPPATACWCCGRAGRQRSSCPLSRLQPPATEDPLRVARRLREWPALSRVEAAVASLAKAGAPAARVASERAALLRAHDSELAELESELVGEASRVPVRLSSSGAPEAAQVPAGGAASGARQQARWWETEGAEGGAVAGGGPGLRRLISASDFSIDPLTAEAACMRMTSAGRSSSLLLLRPAIAGRAVGGQ